MSRYHALRLNESPYEKVGKSECNGESVMLSDDASMKVPTKK